jgi:hypothetical protein
MKSGGGLSDTTTVEVDDSEDTDDPVPTRGLRLVIVPGSSANWGRSAIDGSVTWLWRCVSGPPGATGIEFCRERRAG